MHAISSYHGNRLTPTHTPTNRQDRLQYTGPQLVRSVITVRREQQIALHSHRPVYFCPSHSCVIYRNG